MSFMKLGLHKWLKKIYVILKSSRSEQNCRSLKTFFSAGNNWKSHEQGLTCFFRRFSSRKQNSMRMCRFVFRIHFFVTWAALCLVRTVSLPVCKNHAIHPAAFVLVLNNAENIPLSKNIIVVRVSFTCVPPPPYEDTDSWLTWVSC